MDTPPVNTHLPQGDQQELETDNSGEHLPDPPPTFKDTLGDKINVQREIKTSNGPQLTIDVMPDFRNIVMVLIHHSTKIYEQIAQLEEPTITPASLVAYFLELIYSYLAIIDLQRVRLNTSLYGQDLLTLDAGTQFLNAMSWRMVPPFVKDIIKGLSPTFDAQRNNIAYIASLASYLIRLDLSTAYPVTMFLALHNIIAENENDTDNENLYHTWLTTQLMTGSHDLYVGNHIGQGANFSECSTDLITRMKSLISVAEPESDNQTPVFDTFRIQPFTNPEDINETNPYHYLLGINLDNLSSINTAFNLISANVDNLFKDCIPLGELFSLSSGITLMNHYYQTPTLPTGFFGEVTAPKSQVSAESYSKILKFLQPEPKQPDNKYEYPTDTANLNSMLYLMTKSTTHRHTADHLISFNQQKTLSPDVLHFSPYSNGIGAYSYNIMLGLRIESAEIAGFKIPYPNLSLSIKDENSHFLQSAIPASHTTYNPDLTSDDGDIRIRKRPTYDINAIETSFALIDMGITRLPTYDQQVTEPAQHMHHGFTPVANVRRLEYGSTKWSYKIPRLITTEATYNEPSKIFLWSSYRWINEAATQDSTHEDRTFIIASFINNFGTNPLLTKSQHPTHLIPK